MSSAGDLDVVLVGVHRNDRWEAQEQAVRAAALRRFEDLVTARGLRMVAAPSQRVEVLFGAGRTRLVLRGRARR